MEHLATSDPALTVALALLAGIVAQSLAHHLRLPGIVLLLAVGVLLGPDGIGVVQPRSLGGALDTLVNFAVAVILFEGGLNLDLRRLRREATTIRRLVILGSLITGVELAWLWQGAQLIFGFTMFVGLYRLLECFFERRQLGYAFAVISLSAEPPGSRRFGEAARKARRSPTSSTSTCS